MNWNWKRIALVIFFALLAFYFLHLGFPYLEVILGIDCVVLAIAEIVS